MCTQSLQNKYITEKISGNKENKEIYDWAIVLI